MKGRSVAGVVYQPYFNYKARGDAPLGRVVWGVVGLGAFGIDRDALPPADQNIITTTRSHSSPVVMSAVSACSPTQVLRAGGCGHKVMLVIEGEAHAYVFGSPGCKKWDTCAPEAILCALGGSLTDVHGNSYQYHASVRHKNLAGVIATSRATQHNDYVEKMPEDVLQELPTDGPAPWQ